jgi:uncharacterized protein YjbJ (UPF0337 family)
VTEKAKNHTLMKINYVRYRTCYSSRGPEELSYPIATSSVQRLFEIEVEIMDKDRIVGSAKEIKGAVKQAVGKAVGDAKLESEGKADKIEGKVQNAIGGIKDTIKGK